MKCILRTILTVESIPSKVPCHCGINKDYTYPLTSLNFAPLDWGWTHHEIVFNYKKLMDYMITQAADNISSWALAKDIKSSWHLTYTCSFAGRTWRKYKSICTSAVEDQGSLLKIISFNGKSQPADNSIAILILVCTCNICFLNAWLIYLKILMTHYLNTFMCVVLQFSKSYILLNRTMN